MITEERINEIEDISIGIHIKMEKRKKKKIETHEFVKQYQRLIIFVFEVQRRGHVGG